MYVALGMLLHVGLNNRNPKNLSIRTGLPVHRISVDTIWTSTELNSSPTQK